MGLSIHYRGRLKDASTLKLLIEEVRDIAKNNSWEYFVFEEEFPNNAFSKELEAENLYGLMIIPPESEPFCLSFLSNGVMCGIINFNIFQKDIDLKESDLQQSSCKTQFAGYEVHKQLILLCDYLNSKYLSDFNCIDEGHFWETRDEILLKDTFDKYTTLSDSFSSSLEMIPQKEDENLQDYLIRLAEVTAQNIEEAKVNNDNGEDLPELNIEEENEFKKLKLNIEFGAHFPDEPKTALPPEIEGAFLDYIYNFERMYSTANMITVFEKIGNPDFPSAKNINDEELDQELERLIDLLGKNNIELDLLCHYTDQNRLIYTFITEELFLEEIEDAIVPDMVCHFIYEEYHPNHKYDIEENCIAFWQELLDTEDDFFVTNTGLGVENLDELILFRDTFESFSCLKSAVFDIEFDLENGIAIAKIKLAFKAMTSDKKHVDFSGISAIQLVYEYGYWCVKHAELI